MAELATAAGVKAATGEVWESVGPGLGDPTGEDGVSCLLPHCSC